MLDVYRTFYGLTGEPFRLGPDYRFSLHHTSYANAKAYLEFAIYQGEGFIAITGAPGTGKTTLISEILANLDRDTIDVATLNSTQLESRDLLQMVASSFGLQTEQHNKADLLLEIERFLIQELGSGHRAILIVDEAQGLSPDALEELRQLANLQYQYQLLLQIVLVGQERLLELIRAPGMEHLQQRLVAATSLEPLGFDETIDYIEHRLTRVGWKGDPAIAEDALRLVYCYSGGIPRRINLITNRLFLYGGMEEKHQLNGDDGKDVVEGLIAEFLLPREPLIQEAAIGSPQAAGGEKPKLRKLPRCSSATQPGKQNRSAGGKQAQTTATPGTVGQGRSGGARPAGNKPSRPAPNAFRMDRESLPGSRRQPAGERAGAAPSAAAGEETQRTVRRPPASGRGTQSPHRGRRAADRGRRAGDHDRRSAQKPGSGRSVALVLLLLVGAGLAYFIQKTSVDLRPIHAFFGKVTGLGQPGDSPQPAAGGVTGMQIDSVSAGQTYGETGSGSATGETGQVVRSNGLETEGVPETPAHLDDTAPEATAPDTAASSTTGDGLSTVYSESETIRAEPETAEPEAAAVEAPSGPADIGAGRRVAVASAVAGHDSGDPATSRVSTAGTRPAASKPEPAAVAKAATGTALLETQRARLRKAAEQRFSEQVERVPPAREVAAGQPAEDKLAPQKIARADTVATLPAAKPARKTADEVRDILLKGRWSSSGNPATLLPSERTYCHAQIGNISCVSVPQNVKTQYGPALYKVNTTLTAFAASGHFKMSYRTMVRLVSGGKENTSDGAAKDQDWQVTEYDMSCELSDEDKVSCLDAKGITRRYSRVESGSAP